MPNDAEMLEEILHLIVLENSKLSSAKLLCPFLTSDFFCFSSKSTLLHFAFVSNKEMLFFLFKVIPEP